MKQRIVELEAHIEQLAQPSHRALVLICALALTTVQKPAAGRDAVAHVGVADRMTDVKHSRWQLQPQHFNAYAALAPGDLIKLTVEALVRDDFAEAYEGYGVTPHRADWYLGAEQPAEIGSDAINQEQAEASVEPIDEIPITVGLTKLEIQPDDMSNAAWAEYLAWKNQEEFGAELEDEG